MCTKLYFLAEGTPITMSTTMTEGMTMSTTMTEGMTMSTTMTKRMTMCTVNVTVESDPIGNLFKKDTSSGMTNIILLVIAVVFFLIALCLAVIIQKHHYKCTVNDILQIHVGSQTFEIPKNDVSLEDVFKKFNAIILFADLHIDESNTRVKDAIVELRLIITEWEKNAKLAKTDIQNVTEDNIERDSRSRSTWFDEMLPALMNLINE